MNLKALGAFVEVANEGHFGRAAKNLGITQSGLSQMIKGLEQTIGARLVDRTTRSVALTEVGEVFLVQAQGLIHEYRLVEERMSFVIRGEDGTVRLGFVASAALRVVPWAASLVHKRAPRIKLSLSEMTSDRQLTQLKSGEIDVGVMREITQSSGLVIYPLTTEPLLVAIPTLNPLSKSQDVQIMDLADQGFIMNPRTSVSFLHDHIHRLCHNAGFTPHVVEQAVQFTTILGLVSSNAGIAIVPQSVAAIKLPNVSFLKINDPAAVSQIYLARSSEEKASPVAKRFVDVLRSEKFTWSTT
jgi:DNA-binding transcriptional LysR family regulator